MSPDSNARVKCLLVDDLGDNLSLLEGLLSRADVELLSASSGPEALELLLANDIALALIDVQMPNTDGFELAERMRASTRTRTVPIIFITAGLREGDHVFQGYDAGAVDFLFKPIDGRILRHKAETFFELHRQRQALSRQLELLRQSEELRTRLIESSHDAIVVLDPPGRLLARMGGSSRLLAEDDWARVAGQPWASFWRGQDRAAAVEACRGARSGGVGRFLAQSELPFSAGSWWDVTVTAVHDADGKVERLLAIARDVSAQYEAQAERERLSAKLADTLSFNETFVAAVGHDLRNPLNAILMATELLVRRTQDPTLLKTARRLQASGRRIASMIDDLSDMARARLRGGIPVRLQATDLLGVASRVIGEYKSTHPDRAVELQIKGDLAGQWDGARMEQVISNLLANAFHHGEEAGTVSLSLDGSAAKYVVLVVHNWGHIPPELLPQIFEPFRAGRKDRTRSEGLGLGLFIVRQLVLAHHGSVTLTSSEAAGTTARIELPRGVEPPPEHGG